MAMKVTGDNVGDAACGLHWFCVHWHNGKSSALYSIQCDLEYKPGPLENGADTDNEFYNHLEGLAQNNYVQAELEAEEMLTAIIACLEDQHVESKQN